MPYCNLILQYDALTAVSFYSTIPLLQLIFHLFYTINAIELNKFQKSYMSSCTSAYLLFTITINYIQFTYCDATFKREIHA